MTYPYLSDFLRLTAPDGSCVELFNGCRTIAAAGLPGKAHGDWRAETAAGTWPGQCSWAWDTGEALPWEDTHDSPTGEVAGPLVDPPDGAGHGFYIEPLLSERLVSAEAAEPLEMYATFGLVAGSAAGERAWLRWFNELMATCGTDCDGWRATVFVEPPCEEDYEGFPVDPEGTIILQAPDPKAPQRPDTNCSEAAVLEPWEGAAIYPDAGERTLAGVFFKGIEQLSGEEFHGCAGNRYKITFEVDASSWVGSELVQGRFDRAWSMCDTLCRPLKICRPSENAAYVCGGDIGGPSLNIRKPLRSTTISTSRGKIALPGRYKRPERTMLQTVLTAPLPGSRKGGVRVKVGNSGLTVQNLRMIIWPALDGYAPPDTLQGWSTYKDIDPIWQARIWKLEQFESLVLGVDGKLSLYCPDGGESSGWRVAETSGSVPGLDCGRRYWVGLELSAHPLARGDFKVGGDVSVFIRESL